MTIVLAARVSALLDGSQRRGRAGRWATASILTVACLVVLILAPVRAETLPRELSAASAEAPASQRNTTGERVASPTPSPGSQYRLKRIPVGTGLDRALIRAAAEGDISGIDELLRAGANVNCTVEIGEFGSPLTAAAYKGRLDAVRLLLDRGADPNLAGDGTPLTNAAEGGYVDIVSLLLDRGANIDQITPGRQNALIRASGKGRLEVVKLLVARGADINARAWVLRPILKKANGETVVKRMTRVRVNKDGTREIVDDTTKQGEWVTPLSMAKRGNHKEVVDFLLASGARE
jgi:ankyrin repeat protein